MGNHNVLIGQLAERIPVLAVQLVEGSGQLGEIGLILRLIGRVGLHQPILHRLRHLLGVYRAQPGMRVKIPVVMVLFALMLLLMPFLLMVLRLDQIKAGAGFNSDQAVLALAAFEQIIHPALQACTLISEHIGLQNLADISGFGLPVMGLHSGGNGADSVNPVSPDFGCKII
ncbi:hypothetical protein D3C75_757250 [compost metagenome]